MLVEEADADGRVAMSMEKKSLGLILGIDSLLTSTFKIRFSPITRGNTPGITHARHSLLQKAPVRLRARPIMIVVTGPLTDDVSSGR